jgi:hypothetical protein
MLENPYPQFSRRQQIVMGSHPKFQEYVDFLTASARLDCQPCPFLINFTIDGAMETLGKCAIWNSRKTKIEDTDTNIEETALLEAQQVIVDEVNSKCTGEYMAHDPNGPQRLEVIHTIVNDFYGKDPEMTDDQKFEATFPIMCGHPASPANE